MADTNKNIPSEKVEKARKIAHRSNNLSGFFDGVTSLTFRMFRWFSSLIDRVFFSERYLVIFAFLLACLMYFVVNFNSESLTAALSSSKTVTGIPVTARYNSESFELSGLPSACDVIISGDAANVNGAANRSGSCLINLEGYTEGTHLVDIVPTGFGDNVSTTATPNQAQIILKRKTTAQFDLSFDYINQNDMDSRYILGVPEFAAGSNKVNIRASQDTLDSIALVKALIDVKGRTEDFVTDAPLVAYNAKGQMVNAEIVPATVSVTVKVSSPHKTVPITLNITGEAPAGFSLDSVSMDRQSTEIYARENILADINEVKVNLDLSTITGDTDIIQPVILPAGVSSSDVTMVNIKTTLSDTVSKTLINVPIVYRNNNSGLGASYVDMTSVSVIVYGSASNIEPITTADISVYLDVAGLEAGTYSLPLIVEKNTATYCTFTTEPSEINITLVGQE